jgi:hypothetical protein
VKENKENKDRRVRSVGRGLFIVVKLRILISWDVKI